MRCLCPSCPGFNFSSCFSGMSVVVFVSRFPLLSQAFFIQSLARKKANDKAGNHVAVFALNHVDAIWWPSEDGVNQPKKPKKKPSLGLLSSLHL